MRQAELFDGHASHAARDDALAMISARANNWMERAAAVIALLPKGWLGIGEDYRLHVERIIGPPHHSNVTGALILKASKRGLIERTGPASAYAPCAVTCQDQRRVAANMSKPRFTVELQTVRISGDFATGWCVFDRGRRITIPFADYSEAERHRDNIHRLYLRWGW